MPYKFLKCPGCGQYKRLYTDGYGIEECKTCREKEDED